MVQPRDHEHERPRDPDNGRFTNLSASFERERVEHGRDHEQERLVAKDTAQRLEREVEQTALRLERIVMENAQRIEGAVATALAAVAETARVHADAHAKEHQAHERIHSVEKEQVAKAEELMNKRLEGMNEFRAALTDQASRAVSREYYDARHEQLKDKVVALEKTTASSEAVDSYKRIVYGTAAAGLISLSIAIFNLVTK